MLGLIPLFAISSAMIQAPIPTERDFTFKDFHFMDSEVMPEARIHCTTFGTIHRGASGKVDNAVLIMHGTGGSGHSLINRVFSGELFGPGQLLDANKYFLILPDALGHGKSSKPSDGLHAKFPHFGYRDMVQLQYKTVTEGLQVDHLRLVMGTSMGAMQTYLWGETYPDFMDALMPLACLPVQIAGRNRMTRKMIIDAIKDDPGYNDGEYKTQPYGLREAADVMILMGSAPLQMMKQAPTRDEADTLLERMEHGQMARMDANDILYQVASSFDYNPEPDLEKITAPLTHVNSADDFINPPELGIAEKLIKRVKHGKFVLIPISDKTHGHGTHTYAAVWENHLKDLLDRSGGRR
ncbi:MAG TPA: alpha/beta fold hydrolase [Fimbriimonadaceae bacterium]|jgi:homoserine O-acetyltransferase